MWKRLYHSSKVKIALVTLILNVAVVLGLPEDISDQLTAPLLWIINAIGLSLIGGTAIEDLGTKMSGGTPKPPLILLLFLLPVLLQIGCAGGPLFEGWGTQTALKQDHDLYVDTEQLAVSESGTADTKTLHAENTLDGEVLVERDAEGNILKVSGATGVTMRDATPKTAADAYTSVSLANAQTQMRTADALMEVATGARMMMENAEALIPLLAPFFGTGSVPLDEQLISSLEAQGIDCSDGSCTLESILERLRNVRVTATAGVTTTNPANP